MISRAEELFVNFPRLDWNLRSRIHPLWQHGQDEVWVKRDDELSVIGSGPKRRKHSSFLAKVLADKTPGLILSGSPFSSNTLAMASACKELGIPFTLKNLPLKSPLKGNAIWNEFLAKESPSPSDDAFMLVPEGCNHPWALPGALSLGLEIPKEFDRIIVDAGTGFGAAALALSNPSTPITVLKMAKCSVKELAMSLGQHFGLNEIAITDEIELSSGLSPITGQSWQIVKETWIESGLILDPIYTARSFNWTKNQLKAGHLPGRSLLIHTGGAMSLLGFEKELLSLTAT